MFINNKYKKWYDSIVVRAKTRKLECYIERHHILPRCLGGTDDVDNIAELTAREHFICHRLLSKFVIGTFYKKKMLNAIGKFVQCNSNQHRNLTSKQYEIARAAIAEANSNREYTDGMRDKMRKAAIGRDPWNKGLTGKQEYPDYAKQKLSDMYAEKTFEDRFGQEKATEIKKKISESRLGKPSGMLGKIHTKETKEKMSENMKGPRGPQRRIDKCPHCGSLQVTLRHIKFCKGN